MKNLSKKIYKIDNMAFLMINENVIYKIFEPLNKLTETINNHQNIKNYYDDLAQEDFQDKLNFEGEIYWYYPYIGIDANNNFWNWNLIESGWCIWDQSIESKLYKFREILNKNKMGIINISIVNGIIQNIEIINLNEENISLLKNKIINISSYKFDYDTSLNYLFELKNFNNLYFEYIDKTIPKLKLITNPNSDDLKRIVDIFEMIKFAILKSDFINALRSLRSLRNSIIEYIYDDYFIPIFRGINYKFTSFENDLSSIYKDEEMMKENEESLKKDVQKIEKYFQKNQKKNLPELISEKYDDYYQLPTYFSHTKFNDLKEEKFNIFMETKMVTSFLRKNLLSNQNFSKWEKASNITNSAIHKNNYDLEGFQDWWINDNELETLKEITQIFLEPIFAYNKFKKTNYD